MLSQKQIYLPRMIPHLELPTPMPQGLQGLASWEPLAPFLPSETPHFPASWASLDPIGALGGGMTVLRVQPGLLFPYLGNKGLDWLPFLFLSLLFSVG